MGQVNLSLELGLEALDATASRHAREIAQLVPLAKKLAMACGSEGVIISDLRDAAVLAGLLTGHERGKQLSFLGAVMRAAGLMATNEFRRSKILASHGNPHRVWRIRG